MWYDSYDRLIVKVSYFIKFDNIVSKVCIKLWYFVYVFKNQNTPKIVSICAKFYFKLLFFVFVVFLLFFFLFFFCFVFFRGAGLGGGRGLFFVCLFFVCFFFYYFFIYLFIFLNVNTWSCSYVFTDTAGWIHIVYYNVDTGWI